MQNQRRGYLDRRGNASPYPPRAWSITMRASLRSFPAPEDEARTLAVRLTTFFARAGWNAVAESLSDVQGRWILEVRGGDLRGDRRARDRSVLWRKPVDDRDLEVQEAEVLDALRGYLSEGPSRTRLTVQPAAASWCLAD